MKLLDEINYALDALVNGNRECRQPPKYDGVASKIPDYWDELPGGLPSAKATESTKDVRSVNFGGGYGNGRGPGKGG